MNDLFEYLKDILYSPDKASVDLDEVPDEQKKLAQGLMVLNDYMQEGKRFAEGLSRGQFDIPLPAPDNPLTGELRDLHGALTHLIWQAEQVTKGDYAQRLDFMGALSDVFNDMVETLDDRETRLQQEKEVVSRQNERLRQSQELHVTLMELMQDWVIVSDRVTGSIYHMNEACQTFMGDHPEVFKLVSRKLGARVIGGDAVDDKGSRWEFSIIADGYANRNMTFEVSSMAISWDRKQSVVSIFHDVTREREVEFYAYHDTLTGLYNRRYAIEELSRLLTDSVSFRLIFADLDGLKYVNDTFGHETGNRYILDFVRILSKMTEPRTVCRMGGDEFIIIAYGDGDCETLIEQLRSEFIGGSVEYLQSFSYGIADSLEYDNTLSSMINVSAMLEEVDSTMYHYKVKNKVERAS